MAHFETRQKAACAICQGTGKVKGAVCVCEQSQEDRNAHEVTTKGSKEVTHGQ